MLNYTNYDTGIIPKRIKLAKQHREMTRRKLAEKMGYGDPGSISQYFVEIPTNPTKQRVPNLETLCKFANALDCDLEYLLGVLPEGVYRRVDYDVMKVTGLSEKAVRKLSIIKAKGKAKLLSDVMESHNFFHVISAIEKYKYMRRTEEDRQKHNIAMNLYMERHASDHDNILVQANEPDSRDRLGNESVAFARYSALLLFGDLADDISGEGVNNDKKSIGE